MLPDAGRALLAELAPFRTPVCAEDAACPRTAAGRLTGTAVRETGAAVRTRVPPEVRGVPTPCPERVPAAAVRTETGVPVPRVRAEVRRVGAV